MPSRRGALVQPLNVNTQTKCGFDSHCGNGLFLFFHSGNTGNTTKCGVEFRYLIYTVSKIRWILDKGDQSVLTILSMGYIVKL